MKLAAAWMENLLGSCSIWPGLYLSDHKSETWPDRHGCCECTATCPRNHRAWLLEFLLEVSGCDSCYLLCTSSPGIKRCNWNHPEQTWAVRFKNLLLSMKRYMIKHFFQMKMRSATITAINLIRSIIPLSQLHMRKIPFLKFLLKTRSQEKEQSIKFGL